MEVVWDSLPQVLQRLTGALAYGRIERLADGSELAFKSLGTNAISAIPELTAIMRNTNAPETANRAIYALTWIGTNGLPALLSAAEDPQLPTRSYAVRALAYLPTTNAGVNEIVGPMLLRCLNATNDLATINEAASGLGVRTYAPEVSVPILLSCFTNAGTNTWLRQCAGNGLMLYGTPTLPALTNALNDPRADVRTNASMAIKIITSGVLTNIHRR
jgi:HEAT repeat protein